MKTFAHEPITVEVGVGQGDGHSHLCFNIGGKKVYAHLVVSSMSKIEVTVDLYPCQSDYEFSSEPIRWHELPDKHNEDIHLELISF